MELHSSSARSGCGRWWWRLTRSLQQKCLPAVFFSSLNPRLSPGKLQGHFTHFGVVLRIVRGSCGKCGVVFFVSPSAARSVTASTLSDVHVVPLDKATAAQFWACDVAQYVCDVCTPATQTHDDDCLFMAHAEASADEDEEERRKNVHVLEEMEGSAMFKKEREGEDVKGNGCKGMNKEKVDDEEDEKVDDEEEDEKVDEEEHNEKVDILNEIKDSIQSRKIKNRDVRNENGQVNIETTEDDSNKTLKNEEENKGSVRDKDLTTDKNRGEETERMKKDGNGWKKDKIKRKKDEIKSKDQQKGKNPTTTITTTTQDKSLSAFSFSVRTLTKALEHHQESLKLLRYLRHQCALEMFEREQKSFERSRALRTMHGEALRLRAKEETSLRILQHLKTEDEDEDEELP